MGGVGLFGLTPSAAIDERASELSDVDIRRGFTWGATFFSADTVESETKFSLDVGGGLKYFPSAAVGARAHIRYKPTFLNDSSSADFCDPFGLCQGVLQQIEFAGAVVVRF